MTALQDASPGGPTIADGPIGSKDALDLLHGMLVIPSVSGHEQNLARFLRDRLLDLGFRAHIDATGNVVGELGDPDGPTVMLLGHMDTVPGDVPVERTAERLCGRGAVDAKSPLASMICAARNARIARGRVVVVGVVEEETPASRGAVGIRESHRPPAALIVGEPSGAHTVVLGYKGKLDLRVQASQPPTHPSNPEPKASELVVQFWTALGEELGTHEVTGFNVPTATLVSIQADAVVAEAVIDVRTPPGFDVASLLAALDRRVPEVEVAVLNAVPACRTTRADPVVVALQRAITERGHTASVKLKTATSDMNTLGERWSVPMATYGPGDSRFDHADDEQIAVEEFLEGVAVLTAAVESLAASLPAPHDEPLGETSP